MSVSKSPPRTALAVLAFLPALSPGEARARAPIHQFPPLSARASPNIIHQFPPLQPVPGVQQPAATETPRAPSNAPTLEEAPRLPHDGPTFAELGVPPPEPSVEAGETVSNWTGAPGEPPLGAEAAKPSVVETYVRKAEAALRADEDRAKALFDRLRSGIDLESFLSPIQKTIVTREPAETPKPAQGDAEAPASDPTFMIAGAIAAVILALLAYGRRRSLRARLPADPKFAELMKRIRTKKEDEEPLPPVDPGRIAKATRAAAPTLAAPPRLETGEPPPPTAPPQPVSAAPAPAEDMTDDLVLVEPGDAAAAAAAINAARTQQEGTP